MIAAAQLRYRVDEAPPINMVGILVVADQFTFVTATITKEYLECLSEKATPPTLEFHWWPAETASKYPHQGPAKTGIPYGDVANREIISKTLCLLQRKFLLQCK
jgi:hypothetical protein